MPEKLIRQRKKKATAAKVSEDVSSTKPSPSKRSPEPKKPLIRGNVAPASTGKTSSLWKAVKILNCMVGLCIMAAIGYKFAEHVYTLHENHLWFTNIKEVEREISFRTECGLYYSYYKQILQAPTFTEGILALTNDNLTEHQNTVNILSRFNVYQEVLLAGIYKSCSYLQDQTEGIMFYIISIFGLQGVLVSALFAMAWIISGTWVSGALAAAFYIFNKPDTTRVDFVVALRENFALPFLWVQLAAISYYLKPSAAGFRKKMSVFSIAAGTFLFSIMWQFNQFVLLLQAMALFGAQILQLVPHNKILTIYSWQMISMLLVCCLQFLNTMILGGFLMSFIPSAIVIMLLQHKIGRCTGLVKRTVLVLFYIGAVFTLTGAFNMIMKFLIHQEADEHIFKFVLAKFGVQTVSRDFDVLLYLCNGAFEFLDISVAERLTHHIVFPVYAFVHVVGLLGLVIDYFQQCGSKPSQGTTVQQHNSGHLFSGRPDLAYHLIQPVFFGIMAISTLRMKYLWTPYMCVLAASILGSTDIWEYLMRKIGIAAKSASWLLAHVWLLAVLSSLVYIALPKTEAELKDLREFYDPDTVDLMEWINTETSPSEAFSGSMQLLAGVKLTTGRPITNHPHYEDKDLRRRTKELYQIYGRQPADEVHRILRKYNATYIILEDSICLAPVENNCRLPDIVDLDNGIVPDGGSDIPGLVQSNTKRFCDEIRYSSKDFSNLFRLVFQNKTFRVYKVLV